MGFLIAEVTLMLVIAAVSGALLSYWWVRRQYRDVTTEYKSLKLDLETAQTRLAAPPLELTPHEEPKPQSRVSPETLSALLSKVEQSVAGINDANIARVMAMEGQLRTLSRQLQDVLPHPIDGQDIARRLDTLGAAIPQPKLNHMEARLGRLETMIAGLCTHAGTEVPPVAMLSRLPSTPTNSRLPSSPLNSRISAAGTDSKLPSVPPAQRPSSSTAPQQPSSQRPSSAAVEQRSPSTPSTPSSAVPGPPSSLPPRAPRPRRTDQL